MMTNALRRSLGVALIAAVGLLPVPGHASSHTGAGGGSGSSSETTCPQTNVNPIGDMCWECLFPISIGPVAINERSGYPDTANPNWFICFCPVWYFWRSGLAIGFWQPGHLVDVTRKPGCIAALGGMDFDVTNGVTGEHSQTMGEEQETAFYNLHWIRNYYMEWLIDEVDDSCLQDSEETTYLSEIDSTWEDPEAAITFSPEAVLFTSPIANAACAIDCVASTIDVSFDAMVWCQGCLGTTYPLGGWVGHHAGGAVSAGLLVQRAAAKNSRMYMLKATHAHSWIGYCFQHNDWFIDKSQYRHNLIYPVPQTEDNSLGGCCQPFGRSPLGWANAKEYPYGGEDWVFIVWEKRHVCCE